MAVSAHVRKRRMDVSRLFLRGHSHREIAQKLQITSGTVSHDIKRCMQEWRRRSAEFIHERQLIELQRLDHIEAEAMEAWERSKQDAVMTRQTESEGGDIPSDKKKVDRVAERRGQSGDARYLSIAIECSKDRRKLLGLDKPTEVKLNVDHSRQFQVHVESLTIEQQRQALLIIDEAERQANDPPAIEGPSFDGPALDGPVNDVQSQGETDQNGHQ